MRRVTLSYLLSSIREESTRSAFKEVELASNENDLLDIANAFTITGTYTPTRNLNVTAPSTANIAAVLATFIDDCRRGGQNRTN